MERVTFFESLIKILKTVSSIPLFIEILILTLFLLTIMIFFYFRESKNGRVTALIIYCVTLCLLPLTHLSFFINTIDKIVENYIKILYFPSCYVYIVTLIITDVSLLFSLVKDIRENNRKWYMVVDLIYFSIFQFLFFMIVRLVVTNDIDVFERAHLYSNANLTSCIQISSYLFWIRIGIILVSKLINRLSSFELKENSKVLNTFESKCYDEIPKKVKSQQKEILNIKEEKTYNDTNNDLIKKLLGQDYTVDSNDSLGIEDKNDKKSNKRNKEILKETVNKKKNSSKTPEYRDDYFYDDFFE